MIVSIVLYLFCCGAAGMNLFVLPQPRGSRVGRRLHSAQIHTYMQHKPIYTAQYNQGICNWELTSDLRCSGSCNKNFVKISHMNITACFLQLCRKIFTVLFTLVHAIFQALSAQWKIYFNLESVAAERIEPGTSEGFGFELKRLPLIKKKLTT